MYRTERRIPTNLLQIKLIVGYVGEQIKGHEPDKLENNIYFKFLQLVFLSPHS